MFWALLQVLNCGLNMAAPDLLTPSKAAAAVWTWAPGHPFEPVGGTGGWGGEATEEELEAELEKGEILMAGQQRQQQHLYAQGSDLKVRGVKMVEDERSAIRGKMERGAYGTSDCST